MKLVKIFKKNGEVIKYIIQEKEDLKIYMDLVKVKSKLNTVTIIPVTNIEHITVSELNDTYKLIPFKYTKSEVE